MEQRKFALLMDFYELTMSNGYFLDNKHLEEAVFDMFYRSIPDSGGYALFSGLEQIIDYIQNLKFEEAEIKYLKSKNIFDDKFLNYLKNFKFSSTIYAMKEGTPIFPKEPILIVRGPIIECQLIETMILLTINHQTLIATKASRIVYAARGRLVMEFGARRAHGYDASIYGARAAYIGGVDGSSNTYVDYKYQIPALGTMAHSYVQSYPSEYEAFLAYAKAYPNDTTLLIDTYNTIDSGLKNAIKVHKNYLLPNGYYLKAVRLDSGDLSYLSKKVREVLDSEGLLKTQIVASNSLDEFLINDLINQGAQIDSFGVGERLITARSEAVFGGVYKLAAFEENGVLTPKIKISDNIAKMTIPGFKQVYRMLDQKNMAIADVITLHDEVIDENKPYLLFDPDYPYKNKLIENYQAMPLLIPIFVDGKLVYNSPSLKEIRNYAIDNLKTLWPEVRRFKKPHQYYVDFSQDLWDLRQKLIEKHQKQ